jgi:hypothetical protein
VAVRRQRVKSDVFLFVMEHVVGFRISIKSECLNWNSLGYKLCTVYDHDVYFCV